MVQPSLDLEQQEGFNIFFLISNPYPYYSDKIIVWYDEAHDNNMAMSFQDNNGAEDTWLYLLLGHTVLKFIIKEKNERCNESE